MTKIVTVKDSPAIDLAEKHEVRFFAELIKVGQRAEFMTGNDFQNLISTSGIRALLQQGTGQDKLVIPKEFEGWQSIDQAGLELAAGEMLFSTYNSIYTLTDIKDLEVKNET